MTILDSAFTDLAKSKTLVIDLRLNGGESDELALKTVSRLIDEPTDLFTKEAYSASEQTKTTISIEPSSHVRFDEEIIVLVSPLTASAAEVLGVSLRKATGATVIGLGSEGIFPDIIPWTLPGDVELSLSMEIYRDLEGESYGVRGVPIDTKTSIDTSLEKTLEKARG